MPLRLRRAAVSLLDGVHERLEALDADFEAVAGFNRSDAAGRAGKNDVAGEQGHVGRNESDQIVAIEDELAGVGILTELTILKKLDGEIVRITTAQIVFVMSATSTGADKRAHSKIQLLNGSIDVLESIDEVSQALKTNESVS